MPSRKNIKPPPNFSFVNAEFEGKGVKWLKVHSGAVRSHAAYWGGPAKCQRQGKKQGGGPDTDDIVSVSPSKGSYVVESVSGHSATSRCRKSTRPRKSVKATTLSSLREFCTPPHIEYNNLQNLPSVPFQAGALASSPLSSGLPMFDFCGTDFVKQFILHDHEDHSVLFSAFLLLSYSHYLALTGQGSQTAVLELKGQVIRGIGAKMKTSDGLLSPRCLTAVLALGTAIVCLVSQDLPMGLNIWEYINASMKDDYLCCRPESADRAQNALDERIVHRQAMYKLLHRSKAGFTDADSLALLQYLSNWMNISMAIEAAYDPTTVLADVENLFPAISPCENCSIPVAWASPLTCKWVENVSTTQIEIRISLFAELMHRWLATFLDGDGCKQVQTERLMEERATLRQQIGRLEPVARISNREGDAMYESCRWASLVLLAVEKQGIPIRVAAKQVRFRPRLVRRLRMTDLSQLWGTRRGLLLWVTAVCYSATAGQCFPLICTTLLARFMQEISMSPYCFEIAVKPLKRLKLFESMCCFPELTS